MELPFNIEPSEKYKTLVGHKTSLNFLHSLLLRSNYFTLLYPFDRRFVAQEESNCLLRLGLRLVPDNDVHKFLTFPFFSRFVVAICKGNRTSDI